ncbi:uncharacterized protein LOC141688868 [Apium graveolens]|uniref:uncharacterized protein LOC141688868 n=1 Tax=Apium graveolens TaxID=4045 RepID=UPI003D7B1BAA
MDTHVLQMKIFEETLSRLWPCIMKGSPFAFWGHEYSQHGSCLQGWNGLQFISFATLVSGNNNMTKILQNNGVVTSKVARYSKNQIKQAIQTKIGRGLNVYLSCKVITPSLYYLREVTVCIRKIADPQLLNYQFQSCPDYANRDNCGGNNPGGNTIMLPPS